LYGFKTSLFQRQQKLASQAPDSLQWGFKNIMLQEEGIVKKVMGQRALIQTDRKGDCAHCSSRKGCLFMEDGKEALAMVLNPVGAKEGDRVQVTMEEGVFLKNTFLLYFIPVLSLVGGSVLGYFLAGRMGWNQDVTAFSLGFACLVASFFFVSAVNRRYQQGGPRGLPRIKMILKPPILESKEGPGCSPTGLNTSGGGETGSCS
jgi:positive regulator of sigma E activity